jgi:DNA mismatch repair protein MutS
MAAVSTTPLLEQYEGVKARFPGHLVLFRVGDFYETFGDDARLLARELDVVLTARAPDARGERTPMAGVPQHAVETYLGRLVRKGYKVALCDQVEDPKVAKGLVRREVTRVVTPGTVVEEAILGGPESSFLASVDLGPHGDGHYAAVDVSTGEWIRGPADAPGPEGLVSALAALRPREILYHAAGEDGERLGRTLRIEFPRARLESAPDVARAEDVPEALRDSAVAGPDSSELRLVAYLRATQPRLLPHVARVERGGAGRRLVLDAKTLRHLEVHRPMNPDDAGGRTLLDVWDETVTATGRRTLAFWLTNPLADVDAIARRLDAVQRLVDRPAALDRIRQALEGFPDISRIGSRVAGRRARPEELVQLRRGLDAAQAIAGGLRAPELTAVFGALADELEVPDRLRALLRETLPEEIARGAEPAECFRPGHVPEVDRPRAELSAALDELTELERREQLASGIKGLKVGYNQVFGYYFEVTRPNLPRVPAHFHRRQTVAQAERFVSDELDRLAERIASARAAATEAAEARWEEFLKGVEADVARIHRISRAVGELDVLADFAHLARTRGYVRPTVDESNTLKVRDGRHPVLDRLLEERFVPNDVDLDSDAGRVLVLTGPNMSGKSTYMRTIGLLVLLAQAGSFVPAKFAHVGRVDRLFTRMGFTDEIGRGKSSFMVEMLEVAEILRSADARSLVLLDEVGRGTSTFDGLALAWAILRYLHDQTRCRTVLATHYHQLTHLVAGLSGARNGHFAVQERPPEVVFLHRLVPGATEKSYGVHVARLAGLPPPVLKEADRLLAELEASEFGTAATSSTARRRAPRYTQAVLLDAGSAPADPEVEELLRLPLDSLSDAELRRRLEALRARLVPAEEPPP